MKTSKLTWHSDSDSDDPAAPIEGAPLPGASRFNRVVVLKGMFTLDDLKKDAALLLELKEDVREEAETLGQVTSVILYDVSLSPGDWKFSLTTKQKEEDGVMTIKFKDAVSAQACVYKMHGRFFDGRKVCLLTMFTNLTGSDSSDDIQRSREISKVRSRRCGRRGCRRTREIRFICTMVSRW